MLTLASLQLATNTISTGRWLMSEAALAWDRSGCQGTAAAEASGAQKFPHSRPTSRAAAALESLTERRGSGARYVRICIGDALQQTNSSGRMSAGDDSPGCIGCPEGRNRVKVPPVSSAGEGAWATAKKVKMGAIGLMSGDFPGTQPHFFSRLDSLRAGLDTACIDESTIREAF